MATLSLTHAEEWADSDIWLLRPSNTQGSESTEGGLFHVGPPTPRDEHDTSATATSCPARLPVQSVAGQYDTYDYVEQFLVCCPDGFYFIGDGRDGLPSAGPLLCTADRPRSHLNGAATGLPPWTIPVLDVAVETMNGGARTVTETFTTTFHTDSDSLVQHGLGILRTASGALSTGSSALPSEEPAPTGSSPPSADNGSDFESSVDSGSSQRSNSLLFILVGCGGMTIIIIAFAWWSPCLRRRTKKDDDGAGAQQTSESREIAEARGAFEPTKSMPGEDLQGQPRAVGIDTISPVQPMERVRYA